MNRIRRSRTLTLESLEGRHLLSADGLQADATLYDPSAFEQEMLEHLNRMRLAPQAELEILFTDVGLTTARDPDAQLAMTVYQDPSPGELSADWAALSSAPPLAWNASLYDAAYDHTNLMVQYDDQSHVLPGELTVAKRLAAAGYTGSAVGENVFAYMNNVFHGHSAFTIDWGVPDRSHRDNMMSPAFREVGISIVAEENAATQVGPLLVTQDFGDGRSLEAPYLLGVVWDDGNGNGWYDAGEGFSNVQFLIEGTGGTFNTTGMTAGGYQTFVSPGLYTVTAYGGDLPAPMVVRDVLIDTENVKVDFEYEPYENLPPLVDLNGPAEAGVDFQATFVEGWPAVPIVAADAFVSDMDDEQLHSLTATITNLLDPGEYLIADTLGTSVSADYDAASGILSLTGTASLAEYQQILGTLSYGHSGIAPNETPRVIQVEAFDGTQLGEPATVTVGVVRTTLPELTIDDLLAEEYAGGSLTYDFTVRISEPMIRTVTVDFTTEDGSAIAGDDYTATQQTIQFAPGETVQTVSVTLVDDELAEGEEIFYGILSNAAGATIADGTGTVTVTDDDLALKLGTLDFLGVEGLDLTGESPMYRFSTARGGVLTAEVRTDSDSEVVLVLYDRYRSPETIVTSVSTGGVARFDLPDVAAGETYYLEVTGTASDAGLILANVVQQDGSVLTVTGTDGDDVFEYLAGDALQFAFNGLSYSYDWDEASDLVFRGQAGVDRADLTGSPADDLAQLFPGSGVLSSDDYAVSLEATEAIQVVGAGGNDTAQLYDSAGNDSFIADVDAASLTGEGFANSVSAYTEVHAYGTGGGEDTAQLSGDGGGDEFIGKPDITKLITDSRYFRTKFFDHVTVVGGGGDDFARIYGDSGVEHFVGRPRFGEMFGEGFHYRVEDYPAVHGYSRGAIGDTAVLLDSPGDDTLVVTPVFAKVYGEGFFVRAKFFPDVEIVGTGEGADTVRVYDSEGDDTVVLAPGESSIAGPGFARRARGFEQVTAYSREGGYDIARLHDTPGDDAFAAQVGEATLDGDGFYGRAVGFDVFLAYAKAGGFDTATLQDSADADELISTPEYTRISATNYFARAKFFETVQAYSFNGGPDVARLYAGNNDATFHAGSNASTMAEENVQRRVEAFEEVYAEAGTATDTAIFDGTGRDDDLFELGDDWARLSNEALNVLIEAQRFEVISSPFGDDTGESA